MQFDIKGMSCAACSKRVEDAVNKIPLVETCSVNLITNSMTVSGNVEVGEIIKAVEKAGYEASLKGETKKETKKSNESVEIKKRILLSLFFLIPLMYMSMGYNMFSFPLPYFFKTNPLAIALTQFILSAVILIINKKFFLNGFKGLIKKAPNMDTLVALGSFASFVYSISQVFCMSSFYVAADFTSAMMLLHNLYFESAAMILVLISMGKMLEAGSKKKTLDAVNSLKKLTPETAVIIKDGKEITIPINDMKKGDIFVIRPGESIPADGIITEGFTSVNESALTGESIPVDKNTGDTVSQATLNLSGFIKCEAVTVGEETLFSQIIKAVNDSAGTKAPIARIADKISGIFVPCILGVSLITFIIWMILDMEFSFALTRAISVLVISCPCSLGLATPVAITVGCGMGAKMGILFKNAQALEYTGKIKTVAFDKTGTLTKGKPKVTDIITFDYNEKDFLSYAYSLEIKSEHPYAKAICQYAEEKNSSIKKSDDFEILPGNGVKATINNETVYGGSFKFISQKADIEDNKKELVYKLAEAGKTPLFFIKENKLLGIIAVEDELRDNSISAIKELKKIGIKTVIITGDNEKTATAIKNKVKADEVYSEVLPVNKADIIRELSKSGKVAMVGDGINDAPALVSADVGIAVGTGTDIAVDSSDVLLINNNLSNIVSLISLSKKTLKIIYENLFWAFIYNILGIPLAAGVFIPITGWELTPMFGAMAMSISSITVVTNALRIYNIKKEKKKMEITMKIEGMMCMHCEARVKKVLEAYDGVTEATVSHEKNLAVIKMNKELSFEELKTIIENEGYKVIQ